MKSDRVIIVTGGTGFIGSNLVRRLAGLGERIIVIDTHIGPSSLFALYHLEKQSDVRKIDIGDRESLSRLLSSYQDAFIFHLAAETIITDCFDDPWRTMQTNIMGTVNLLEAVRTMPGIKGIIVASSDKAYGKTKTAYTEESPLAGDHPYDVSKSSADLISLAYAKTYGLSVVVTRFGNVYGQGDTHEDRLIPGICLSLARNTELLIRSDGTYVRDYLHVDDVVNGYLLLWNNFNKIIGNAYNFSSPDNYSVLEVLDLASNVLNKRVKYRITNTAQNEIPYQHLNDAKIRAMGWKNSKRLKSSLPDIYRWYEQNV